MAEIAQTRDRFYDGRTAARRNVIPKLAGRMLSICDPEGNPIVRWPIGDMAVIDQNKVNGSMALGLVNDPRPRLILFDSPVRRALLVAEPRLMTWRRQRRVRSAKSGVAWTVLGVALVMLLYFGWRDGSAWVANYVPRQWERNLGDRVREAMLDGLYACDAAEGQRAIDSIGKKLLPQSIADLPLTIDVVRERQVNAFALPGNHIFVFSGLIDRARTPDEVAGVLAHEIGHLELRHPTRGLVQQLGLSAVVSLMFGGNAAGNIAYMATALSYTREMEREADSRAVALLHQAHLRTDGLGEFFRELENDKSLASNLPSWLSSHPGLEERAKAADDAAGSEAGDTAMSDQDWNAVKSICRNP